MAIGFTISNRARLSAKKYTLDGRPNLIWSQPLSPDKVQEVRLIMAEAGMSDEEVQDFENHAYSLRHSHLSFLRRNNEPTLLQLLLRAFSRVEVGNVNEMRSTYKSQNGQIISTNGGYEFRSYLKPEAALKQAEKLEGENPDAFILSNVPSKKRDEMPFTWTDAYNLAIAAIMDDSTAPPENMVVLEGNGKERRMLEQAFSRLNDFLPKEQQRILKNKSNHALHFLSRSERLKEGEVFKTIFGDYPENIIQKKGIPGFKRTALLLPSIAAEETDGSAAVAPSPATIEIPAASVGEKATQAFIQTVEGTATDTPEEELREKALTEDCALFTPLNTEKIPEIPEAVANEITGATKQALMDNVKDSRAQAAQDDMAIGEKNAKVLEAGGLIDGLFSELTIPASENDNRAQSKVVEIDSVEVDRAPANESQIIHLSSYQLPTMKAEIAHSIPAYDYQPSAPVPDLKIVESPIAEPEAHRAPQGMFADVKSNQVLYAEQVYATIRNIICSDPEHYRGRPISSIENLVMSLPGRENIEKNDQIISAISRKLEKHGLVRLAQDQNGNVVFENVTTFAARDKLFNSAAGVMMQCPDKWLGKGVDQMAQELQDYKIVDNELSHYVAEGLLDQLEQHGIIKFDENKNIKSITAELMQVPSLRKAYKEAAKLTIKAPMAEPLNDNRSVIYAEPAIAAQ